MKTKLGIALLAMIALAFVAAAPAAAASVTTEVAWGETVFVGEEGLTFPDITNDTVVWYSGEKTGAPQGTFKLSATSNYIDSATFAGKTGPWYEVGNTAEPAFYVEVPTSL
jgi:hypothetical protein